MKRLIAVLLLVTTAAFALERQPNADYRARREALAQKAKNGLILIFAAVEKPDALHGFRQDDNFYYLSGLTMPGAALLIAPAVEEKSLGPETQQLPPEMRPKPRPYSEVLLLPKHSPQERWTGKRLGPDDAGVAENTGFERVAALERLADEIARFAPAGAMLLVNEGEDAKPVIEWLRRTGPVFARDVKPLIASLRVAKDAGEMERIRKATQASMAAHRAAMKAMKPGVNEHVIATLMTYEFMKNGCEREAYAPIVGSGFNSTVLHYSADDAPIKAGDTVVLDVAGEYSMYASDITRTLPASGKFTPRQREIYDIVLGAQQAAIDAFKAGKSVLAGRDNADSLTKAAYEYINTHGKDSKGQALGQYFIHGVGHHVGLNVHDANDGNKPLQPGAVFTLEPGIYIPEENLGVRIEDIFWVAPDGHLVRLTEGLARTADEVEKAMK